MGKTGKDGSSDNRSWNCGVEGPTDDDRREFELRERQIRNMLDDACCFRKARRCCWRATSSGARNSGNNNAYCQDSDISWLNWEIEEKGESLIEFVRKLTTLRHDYAILRRNRFLRGIYNEELGVKDVTWINASGDEMKDNQWHDAGMRCFGMLIDGRAQPTGIRKRGDDATILLVFNGAAEGVNFTLPVCAGGDEWTLMIDTNRPEAEKELFRTGDVYTLTGRSILAFGHPNESND